MGRRGLAAALTLAWLAPLAARADDDVEEVRVRGARAEPVRTTVKQEEVREIPGAFGDAFRALDALPGVTPLVSGVPFFFVRGAPPGDVGYFLDGVRVPLLYHLALGPSVIHPGLVDKVDLFTSAYPARYGRFAGAIVSGEVKPPAARFHGEANARLFDTGALLEVPLFDGKLVATAAGRFSYAAALVSAFAPDTRVEYADYQARVLWRATERDTVGVFAFGSFDELLSRDNVRDPDTGDRTKTPFYPLFRTVFHRVDLRWDHAVPRGRVRTALTLGTDESLTGNRSSSNGITGTLVSGRSEWDQRLSKDARARAGADVVVQQYGLDVKGEGIATDPSGIYPPREDVTLGAYASLAFSPVRRLEIEPGLRVDLYGSRPTSTSAAAQPGGFTGAASAFALEPRVRTRLELARGVAHLTTFGVAHQPPAFVVPLPGLSIGRLDHGLQTAVQASQGVELELPLDLTLTVTVFCTRTRTSRTRPRRARA